MEIMYTNDLKNITSQQLTGFFEGWNAHPDPETHLKILQNSYAVWIALHNSRCVGFINALSDGVFYAYIPLLEVLPEFRNQGIATELLSRICNTLKEMYAIDIVCDENIADFYKSRGFHGCVGMVKRDHTKQQGTLKRQKDDV